LFLFHLVQQGPQQPLGGQSRPVRRHLVRQPAQE
jgi:hypothetical protein